MHRAFILPSLFVAALVLSACHTSGLQDLTPARETDWTMYGGTMQRTNIARETLHPPLVPVWEYDANAGFSPYAVVAEGGYIFIANLKGEIHAVNIETGKKALVHNFGSAIFAGPVIDGSVLYVALSKGQESFIAFDMKSASTLWKTELGGIEASPLLVGVRLYVVSLWGGLSCVDKHDGKVLWTYKDSDESNPSLMRSPPVSDGTIVVFCRDDGSIFAVKADSGNLVWRAKVDRAIPSAPLIAEGALYVGSLDSCFYSFDLSTGAMRWRAKLDGRIFASPALGSNTVYVGTGSGSVYCLDRDAGRTEWKFQAQSGISAAPIISGDVIYAGSLDQSLYALDAVHGAKLWSWKTEGRIKTTPLLHGGYLVLLRDNRTVTAFREEQVKP